MGVAVGDYDDGYDNLFVTRKANAACFTTTGVRCIDISGGGRQKRKFGSIGVPSLEGFEERRAIVSCVFERLQTDNGGKILPVAALIFTSIIPHFTVRFEQAGRDGSSRVLRRSNWLRRVEPLHTPLSSAGRGRRRDRQASPILNLPDRSIISDLRP
jgi:hypothetical protein